jgi:DNA-binding transcriptional regulator LsrR (DeoR family)
MRPPKTLQIDEEERLMVRLAWACEIEGITQAAAAERFGITRLKVNKTLAEARRRGIVRISINSPYGPCAEMEAELISRFDLADAIVVPSPAAPDDV